MLGRFDEMIACEGYANRSEAVRDMIRQKLTAKELANPDTEAVAAVMMVYDHHQAKLAQKLMELQHSQHLRTISSMHVHIDHHNCLEVVLLRGKVAQISALGEQIVSMKGVKLGKINLVATDNQSLRQRTDKTDRSGKP